MRKKKHSAPQREDQFPLEIEDASCLTDDDWATINGLRRAHQRRGAKGLASEMAKLTRDPVRWVRIMGAFFPQMIREMIRDTMAENGITREDLEEIIRKHEKTHLQ
jgi:hypothetical protein